MSEPFTEKPGRPEQRNMSNASVYSASIQEAMRYDKLRSADYLLVMSILHAVLHGDTEEQWQEEQQRPVQALRQQSPENGQPHTDAANRYEQTVCCLKDLRLWPWESL